MPQDTMGTALAQGYRFLGSRCGIRPDPDRLDLALIVSDRPASAAGVFTTARIAAAPVQVSRARVPAADARGVVVCSGNANACTGERGLADARRMAELAAEGLGCRPDQLLVCSTGVIGRPLPMDLIEPGIRSAIALPRATQEALDLAARAIMTTDTVAKVTHATLDAEGHTYRFTGFAKGAAMIGPNMATMLAFVCTDAAVAPEDLQRVLFQAADRSFNCISVEGHTSTNDSVLLFANGAAGGPRLQGGSLAAFAARVAGVCETLARMIVQDAEGATHTIIIDVQGLRTDAEARQIARTVANSPLVKTAIFGGDPNWGRVVSAAGYAGVTFSERDLTLRFGDFLLFDRGQPAPFDAAAVSRWIKENREIPMELRFPFGDGRCRFWTCDLTDEYIRLNADYTT